MLVVKRTLPLLVVTAGATQGNMATVQWLSPREGESFGPGDRILGAWNTEGIIFSPSFRLCRSPSNDTERTLREDRGDPGGTDICGAAFWPPVTQSGGSYSVSLAAPETQTQAKYNLHMEDAYGYKYESSTFFLSPSKSFGVTGSDFPVTGLSQAPLGPAPAEGKPSQSGATISPSNGFVPGVPDPLTENPISPTANRSSTGNFPHTPPSAAGSASSSIVAPVPNLLAARGTVAPAAYAIPLAVFVAILIITGGLAIRQRHKLRQKYRDSAMKFSVSRRSSHSGKSVGDIENNLNTLTKEDLVNPAPAPVPLFMPVEAYITPKCSTREPLPVARPTVPSVRSPTKPPRPPSTRSILSSGYHLPPITSSSTGLFDGNEATTHSVISGYFEPSPPVSPSQLPAVPKKLRLRDGTATHRN